MPEASTASPASTPGSRLATPASSSWPAETASPCYHLARKITDEIAGLPGPAGTAPAPGRIPAALAGIYRDTFASMQVSVGGNRLLAGHAGVTRTMIPVGAASFIDENDQLPGDMSETNDGYGTR